ncbi:MAG: hypothetical protein ABL900_09780 [Burkholderiaceae bacterium]
MSTSVAGDKHARAYRHWLTGQQHAQRDDWRGAVQAFERADKVCHDSAYSLAAIHALIKANRSADAACRARSLRESEPRTALAHTLESHALLNLGRPEEAVECLRALPDDVVRDHPHLVSLALALQRCRRHDEAIRTFLGALALKMDDAISHFRLGMSFKDIGMKAEAAECVRTAVALGVGSSELAARGQLAFYEREACRWSEAQEALAALRERVLALPEGTPMEAAPFVHAVLCDDPLEQLQVARHHMLHIERSVVALPRRVPRASAGRLRVAYLSADFHQHATSQLVAQAFEAHDRDAFEVTLFSTGPDDASTMRARMRDACEHFVELRGLGFAAMAQRIRESNIDILVDLKGATHDTLLPVLAHRPAPLQVNWLGFPGTSGARFIDYIVGDPIVTPLADAACFSEKIAQLPLCYQPNDSLRERPVPLGRAHWGLPEGKVLLCAFHQSYKISAEVFDQWCALLHALPDACLWLLEWNRNVGLALQRAAAQRGLAPERLVFSPVLPLNQHLSRLAEADLYIDAWPCNAHTTASEALWVGVPVVSVRGRTFGQRVASSVLNAVGLPDFACADVEGYRATILGLASDAPRRANLREYLHAQAIQSPLFKGALFVRELEGLYRRMWDRATRGLAPDHLEAKPA